MRTKRFGFLLSVAVILAMVYGTALNVSAFQMGGSIQGTPINVEPALVSTFAGSAGASGSTDGTGTSARFYYPQGITTDGTNLFVATAGHTIRKIVISTGAVTTIAGSAGIAGSTDGTGTSARFNFPYDITTDGTNLFVADSHNHTIRKIVISTGVVTTIAGSAGISGSTDGTGTSARFSYPGSMTTDGSNLFVTDNNNYTIRKIVISTGAVTTIAGSAGSFGSTDGTGTSARFYGLQGITTDGTSLFVAEMYNHTIRKIVISTGVVTTIAGTAGSSGSTDGTGTSARFNSPDGITTDGTNLFVSDSVNYTIRKIVISTGVVTTIAGSVGSSGSTDGTGTSARFNGPYGITTDGTNLFVDDYNNHTVRKIEGGTSTTCTYTITPTSQTFISSGGTGSVTVTASDSSCAWTATSNDVSWITVISGSSGTGNGTVGYSVTANTSTTSRTGTITIAGQTFTITQSPPTTATYTLTVTKSGTGTGTVTTNTGTLAWSGNTGTASYSSGTLVTLTATANTGSTFSGWSGGSCSGTGTCTVTMNAATSATASFTLNIYTVTPSAGAGGSISPSTPQTVNYNGTTTFTVTPNAGYAAIVGGTCGGSPTSGSSQFTYTTNVITANCTVTVTFSQNTYTLTVTKSGTGTGTVTANTGTITWSGNTATGSYNSGTSVTLTATANTGSTFSGWSGGCSGTGTCTVTMNAAQNITATFTTDIIQSSVLTVDISANIVYGNGVTITGTLFGGQPTVALWNKAVCLQFTSPSATQSVPDCISTTSNGNYTYLTSASVIDQAGSWTVKATFAGGSATKK